MASDVTDALGEAIGSNWIAHIGPSVDAFERELAAWTGVAGCFAAHSGTAAIHLALRLLDVGPGDAVLCSTLTFVASATPIVYLGATPVFVDSDESGSMSPRALQRALLACKAQGLRVKAIVVVHLYGQPADMKRILALADRHGVPVVEDAAQALGSTYAGRPVGAWGSLGIFSFAGNKIITTSTGGALVANDRRSIERARWLGQQARDDVPFYQHSELGYNYRMSNVLAEIGRSQLRVLTQRVSARRAVFARYKAAFATTPGLGWCADTKLGASNRWLSVVLLERGLDPDALIEELACHGIEARRVFKPLHRQPLFAAARYYPHAAQSVSDALFARGVCLPSSSNLSEQDQADVIEAVHAALARQSSPAASAR
jgi:pyridoxal phosphate-dependent aminotransferase EpsN